MLILECHLQEILQGTKSMQYIWVIDRAQGPNCCILAKFFFCMFMDRDGVKVHELTKTEQGQYPAILTEQDWLIKDLLYGKRTLFLCGTQWVR